MISSTITFHTRFFLDFDTSGKMPNFFVLHTKHMNNAYTFTIYRLKNWFLYTISKRISRSSMKSVWSVFSSLWNSYTGTTKRGWEQKNFLTECCFSLAAHMYTQYIYKIGTQSENTIVQAIEQERLQIWKQIRKLIFNTRQPIRCIIVFFFFYTNMIRRRRHFANIYII